MALDLFTRTYNANYLELVTVKAKKTFIYYATKYKDGTRGNTTLMKLAYNYLSIPPSLQGITYIAGPYTLTEHRSSESNKIIYIFGEQHRTTSTCDGTNIVYIGNYLKDLLENSSVFIDFYIEKFSTSTNILDQNPIQKISRDFSDCLNHTNNNNNPMCRLSRSHYIDVRYNSIEYKNDDLANAIQMIASARQNFSNDYELSKLYLYDFKVESVLLILSSLTDDQIVDYIKDQMFKRNYYIDKELKRSYMKNEIKNFISLKIKKYAKKLRKATQLRDREYHVYLYKLFVAVTFIHALYMDTYFLARLFKRFNPSKEYNQPLEPYNIISYTGNDHANNYREFLTYIGYDTVQSSISNDENCVDISQFKQPFFQL